MPANKSDIQFDLNTKILSVVVDTVPTGHSVIESKPLEDVTLTFGAETGSLYEMAIRLRNKYKDNRIHYNDQEDCLYVHLTEEDEDPLGCDAVFMDAAAENLVALNRNKVGNLTGIEIVGASRLASECKIAGQSDN